MAAAWSNVNPWCIWTRYVATGTRTSVWSSVWMQSWSMVIEVEQGRASSLDGTIWRPIFLYIGAVAAMPAAKTQGETQWELRYQLCNGCEVQLRPTVAFHGMLVGPTLRTPPRHGRMCGATERSGETKDALVRR